MPLLPPLVWRPCSLFIFHCNIKIFKYLFSLKYRPLHFVLHNLSYVTLLNISVCCFLCTFHRNKIFLHHHSNSDILDTQKSKHQIRTPFFSLFLLCIFCDKLDLNQRTSYFHNQIRSKPDFLATRHITNTFNIHDHLWRLRPGWGRLVTQFGQHTRTLTSRTKHTWWSLLITTTETEAWAC